MNGGIAMKAGLATAMAALSLSLAGAAAAAPAAYTGHGITQVTGSTLEAALLPPPAFGRGYLNNGASDTGGSLRPPSPARSVRRAECTDIEGGGSLAGYGDTAEANLTVTTGSVSVLIHQDVAQFRTSRAARSFFSQVLALYRRCGSFVSFAGIAPEALVLAPGGITTTSIHRWPAFQADQELTGGEPAGRPLGYAKTVFAVADTDVFEIALVAVRDMPMPRWMPVRLISRVQALYR
jgi:PknH-like extracellular domain